MTETNPTGGNPVVGARPTNTKATYGRLQLASLHQELMRQERTSFDYLADADRVVADIDGDDRLVIELPDVGDFPVTEHGRKQIARKLGIPLPYYKRMEQSGKFDLLAENLNAWFPERGRSLFRTLDGSIRAMLSDRYKPMDNGPVLAAALDTLKGSGVEIKECYLTEERMHVKATVPHLRQDIVDGDTVIPGIVISNSEVGKGSLRVEPFLYRLVCSNGMIGQRALTRVHLGSELDALDGLLSEATLAKYQEATIAIVEDTIKGVFDPVELDKWMTDLREGTRRQLEKPTEAVDWTAKRFSLGKTLTESVLDEFVKGGDSTQWGLANAITAVARQVDNPDDQVDLERIGGEVAVLDLGKLGVRLATVPA